MKAIVANVLFGSILSCLSWANTACAKPLGADLGQLEVPPSPILAAKFFSSDKLPIVPQIINLVDRIFTVKKSNSVYFSVDREAEIVFSDRFGLNLDRYQDLTLDKKPYTYQDGQGGVILGFQDTFWQSKTSKKYWGITTIEHWGKSNSFQNRLNLAKLNYNKLAPNLPAGNSMLTVSGGGNQNLAKENNLVRENLTSREFEKFRGAISYHHGLGENVTVGTGFIYEDSWLSFTQLTHNSDRFPLRTTISLLSEESGGLDFRSHMRLKPTDTLTLNYYHQEEKDSFDANWKIFPSLTLSAKGNSQQEAITKGIKLVVNNQYMSVAAKATLNGDNLQWKLKSQIGDLKFSHSNSPKKSISEIDLDLIEAETLGFQCTAFVSYKTKMVGENENAFTVWGTKLQSGEKIAPNKHFWTLNLGYGRGVLGNGLIASGSIALQPNLFLKLNYQEISANSDDTKIELKIGSK